MDEVAEIMDAVAGAARKRTATQAGGMLLALSRDWRVSHVSENCAELLGIAPDRLLSQPIAALLVPATVHAMRNRLALIRGETETERLYHVPLVHGGAAFDLMLRLRGEKAIIEAFPAIESEGLDVASWVLGRLPSNDLAAQQLLDRAVLELRALTGFDAVLVFRSGSSETAALSRRTGASPFAALSPHPAAGLLQLVMDAEASPVAVQSRSEPIETSGLLCGAEPDFADFARSNGARSALVLPVGDWGFAVLLHHAPRAVALARLAAAELFAAMLALRLQLADQRSG